MATSAPMSRPITPLWQKSQALRALVERLDHPASPLTAERLRQAFGAARVSLDDIRPYVRVSEGTYTRHRILRRDHYELLVLTWAPGQSSGPHDHSGSVCGLQVVSGVLREQFFKDGPDGRCRVTGEHRETAPALTIDPGVAVHSLSNPERPGGELLVTLHVYSPPLPELRRHVARPEGEAVLPVFTRTVPANADRIVIIGGGFSGTMAATHLLRSHVARPLEITLIDQHSALAEGVAYRTADPRHLLNVPAGRMSAFPDDPEHFLRHCRLTDPECLPGTFMPRATYGAYLRKTFLEAAAGASEDVSFRLVRDHADTVHAGTEDRWTVLTASGAKYAASAVVLAVGHRPPVDPLARRWFGPRNRWIADPWASFTLSAIRSDEPLLLLGSGLTAIDTLLSLSPADRTAPIHLISPRGLMPHAHVVPPSPGHTPFDPKEILAAFGRHPSALTLLRGLRSAALSAPDWRGVVDSLRPHTHRLWQGMSTRAKAQFLRHARRFWEIHRHRMATSIAQQVQQFIDSGKVVVHAGRIRTVTSTPSHVHVTYGPTGLPDSLRSLDVNWVVNCTGPGIDVRTGQHPVIHSLLSAGHLSASELGLGLNTTDSGQAVTSDGITDPSLLIIGTLRKAQLWESTAVPELRSQAMHAARAAIDYLHSLEPAAYI